MAVYTYKTCSDDGQLEVLKEGQTYSRSRSKQCDVFTNVWNTLKNEGNTHRCQRAQSTLNQSQLLSIEAAFDSPDRAVIDRLRFVPGTNQTYPLVCSHSRSRLAPHPSPGCRGRPAFPSKGVSIFLCRSGSSSRRTFARICTRGNRLYRRRCEIRSVRRIWMLLEWLMI